MRSILAVAAGALMFLGAVSSAVAQRDAADRADRGQRLDSDSFRNDMLQDQLKKPANPQGWQTSPSPGTKEKPPRSNRKPKPN